MTSPLSNLRQRASATLSSVAFLAVGLGASPAHAADPAEPPMFSFSGFGTLGVVHSSEDRADYTTSSIRPNGAGYSRDWSADGDSRLGAQVTADFSPQLSAVVQVVVEQRYDNSYTPTLEWANLQYQITPDLSIRAGRIRP